MAIDIVKSDFEQNSTLVYKIDQDAPRRSNKLLYFGKKFIWVNSLKEKKTDADKLFLREVNSETGDFQGDEILINKTKDVTGGGIEVGGDWGLFSDLGSGAGGMYMTLVKTERYYCSVSPDSTKLAVYYRKKPVKKLNKLNKDIWGFVVVDDQFNVLWTREVEMPQTEFMMKFYEAEVNNDGTVFCLTQVYKDDIRKYKKGAKPNYNLTILEIGQNDKKPKTKAVSMEDGFLRSVSMQITDNDQVLLTGTYIKNPKASGASGIFFNLIDVNGRKAGESKFIEFDQELDASYESLKYIKQQQKSYKKYGEPHIPNLCFREVYFDTKTEEITLLLEAYRMVTVISNNGRTVTYHFYYDDIYVLRIDTDKNEITRSYKIPKRQYGRNVMADLGISSAMYGDKLFVFFIDNKKNLEIQPDMEPATHTAGAGGYLTGVLIDLDKASEPQRFLMFDSRKEKLHCDPTRFVYSNGDIYGITYEKAAGGGPYRPLRLSLKD